MIFNNSKDIKNKTINDLLSYYNFTSNVYKYEGKTIDCKDKVRIISSKDLNDEKKKNPKN